MPLTAPGPPEPPRADVARRTPRLPRARRGPFGPAPRAQQAGPPLAGAPAGLGPRLGEPGARAPRSPARRSGSERGLYTAPLTGPRQKGGPEGWTTGGPRAEWNLRAGPSTTPGPGPGAELSPLHSETIRGGIGGGRPSEKWVGRASTERSLRSLRRLKEGASSVPPGLAMLPLAARSGRQ